jgi:uncharacterized protein (DUF486 family)
MSAATTACHAMSPAFATAHPALVAAVLSTFSNLFMTFACYGHPRNRPLKIDDLRAALCPPGAVYFNFRG